MVEEKLGIDMSYVIAYQVPMSLVNTKMRVATKNKNLADIKAAIFNGTQRLDDVIDFYSGHTLLHDAVIMNNEELFEFLVKQGANLNVRDVNGYTPMLKAASIGRTEMVKTLLDNGVNPRHKDPFG